MNILYIHGFGSEFDHLSPKVVALGRLGEVYGVNLHYPDGYRVNFQACVEAAAGRHIDLIVGTSMGGFMAASVGTALDIPFVAVNPCTNPAFMLLKYIGKGVDHHGREYMFTKQAADTYPTLNIAGNGLILLDAGDEVINSQTTFEMYKKYFDVVIFHGGCHRFDHMEESLPIILEFLEPTLERIS